MSFHCRKSVTGLGRNERGSEEPVAYLCLQVFFNRFLSSGGLLSLGESWLLLAIDPGGGGYLPQPAAGVSGRLWRPLRVVQVRQISTLFWKSSYDT